MRKWVFGWTFDEMRSDRDFWREVALTSLNHADKAIDVAKRK
jgi:hypothetical protein